MSIHAPDPEDLSEPVGHLLSLGLTQLSIQATLSTSLTASALGLAALATALTSTILTVQGRYRSTLAVGTAALDRGHRHGPARHRGRGRQTCRGGGPGCGV